GPARLGRGARRAGGAGHHGRALRRRAPPPPGGRRLRAPGPLPVTVEAGPQGPDLRFGFNAHEWGVLIPLAAVGFFLNYDTGLLSLAAPAIAEGLGVSVASFGIGVAVIRVAALGSMPVLRLADRVGRRQMLLLSVLAFTVATAATSLAWGLVSFVV